METAIEKETDEVFSFIVRRARVEKWRRPLQARDSKSRTAEFHALILRLHQNGVRPPDVRS